MGKQSNIIVEQAVLSSDSATPSTGYSKIYPKSDGEWYTRNSDGTIKQVTNTNLAPAGVLRTKGDISLTAGDTLITVPTYTTAQGLIDLFYNGSRLSDSQFTETNSTHVTLTNAAFQTGDVLSYIIYDEASISGGVSEELAIAYALVL